MFGFLKVPFIFWGARKLTSCPILSSGGTVKFWKRLSISASQQSPNSDPSSQQQQRPPQHPCVEFVKSFTAHPDAVLAVEMDPHGGDCCVSVSQQLLKFYTVR